MKTKPILLTLLISLALTVTARADIPRVMNFQGKATNKDGAPLNGSYKLTARIYEAETGGSPLWAEVHENVAITNGVFQVLLGSKKDLDLEFKKNYWISAEINADGEMTPRTCLASTGYARTAESLVEDPVIPFYKKGFEIEGVDVNSVRITPGVIDIAGKMFTSTTYSPTLHLKHLSGDPYEDWITGSLVENSYAYVYVGNKDGLLDFKFSNEAPDLSDYVENTTTQPLLYQKYPDLAEGKFYRYLGNVIVNSLGNIGAIRNIGKEEPQSVFYTFSGAGVKGDITINRDTNFSDLTGAINNYNLEARNLVIEKDKTLAVDTGWAYIGVAGTCTIRGTINADGKGEAGGAAGGPGYVGASAEGIGGGTSLQSTGNPASDTIPPINPNPIFEYGRFRDPTTASQFSVPNCLSGAGGGGGGAHATHGGGCGGGAGNYGGKGGSANQAGDNALATSPDKVKRIAFSNCSDRSDSGYNNLLPPYIKYRGAGGGGGYGITGGKGGGVIYIECHTLDFTGVLSANGANGQDDTIGGLGGGGGGGGGTIVVRCKVLKTNTGTFSIAGGTGGTGTQDGGNGAAGANGFAEVILVQ